MNWYQKQLKELECDPIALEALMEKRRQANAAFRQRQKIRMADDPEYAAKVRAKRDEDRIARAARNPAYHADYRKKKILEDPDFDKKKRNDIASDPRKRELRAASVRRFKLKSKYGITPADFDRMWDEQNGTCAICSRGLERVGHKTHVDHSHATGKIRGLLCLQCNTALGKLGEDESTILSMLEYVRKHGTV